MGILQAGYAAIYTEMLQNGASGQIEIQVNHWDNPFYYAHTITIYTRSFQTVVSVLSLKKLIPRE